MITIAIAAAIALVDGIILMGSFSSDSNTAPDFQLRTLDGKHITLASFKGGPVILWFMAAWCPTCVDQSDAITKFKSEFRNKVDSLVIDMWTTPAIGVNSADGKRSETASDLQKFLAKHGNPRWKAALDTDRTIVKYAIIGLGNLAFKKPRLHWVPVIKRCSVDEYNDLVLTHSRM